VGEGKGDSSRDESKLNSLVLVQARSTTLVPFCADAGDSVQFTFSQSSSNIIVLPESWPRSLLFYVLIISGNCNSVEVS
jgi:hypothetical protein